MKNRIRGSLYGIGVGPGDPSLLTLQAKEKIEMADRIFIPVTRLGEESKAFEIIRQVIEIPEEKVVEVVFAMKRDREEQKRGWKEATEKILAYLEQGEQAVLVTIGDVSIYSTAFYVCELVKEAGYVTKMIPGIPSFCAGAALAGISLMEGKESLMILPSLKGMEQIKDIWHTCDNLVIMKAGKAIPDIWQMVEKEENTKAYVLSNIGMEGEYIGELDCKREYGYLTTVIVKRKMFL